MVCGCFVCLLLLLLLFCCFLSLRFPEEFVQRKCNPQSDSSRVKSANIGSKEKLVNPFPAELFKENTLISLKKSRLCYIYAYMYA